MKKKHVKQSLRELTKGLQTLNKITPDLSLLSAGIVYSGETFTVAVASLSIPSKEAGISKVILGEGIAKLSSKLHLSKDGKKIKDQPDEITCYNIAMSRAIEAIDKKLRRHNKVIGHIYEG